MYPRDLDWAPRHYHDVLTGSANRVRLIETLEAVLTALPLRGGCLAVHFIDLDVRFAKGGAQDVPVRAVIRPGQCTRAIDLVGDDRNITAVHMVYEANTRRRGVGAQIRLFGE